MANILDSLIESIRQRDALFWTLTLIVHSGAGYFAFFLGGKKGYPSWLCGGGAFIAGLTGLLIVWLLPNKRRKSEPPALS